MNQLLPSGMLVALIHYTYFDDDVRWHIACMPYLTEFHRTKNHPPHQRSNDRRAVTCSLCKETAHYKSKR